MSKMDKLTYRSSLSPQERILLLEQDLGSFWDNISHTLLEYEKLEDRVYALEMLLQSYSDLKKDVSDLKKDFKGLSDTMKGYESQVLGAKKVYTVIAVLCGAALLVANFLVTGGWLSSKKSKIDPTVEKVIPAKP